MSLNNMLDAEQIRQIRKEKGLQADVTDEIVGVLDIEFTQDISKGIKKLTQNKESSTTVWVPYNLRKGFKRSKYSEGMCKYKKGKDQTIDAIVNTLEARGFKVTFFTKNCKKSDRSGDRRSDLEVYVSISL